MDYTKPQLFARLSSVGLLPEGVNENDKDPDRYNFLKGIKDRTKKVEVRDLETGEITTYPSMYKCAKALEVNQVLYVFATRGCTTIILKLIF